MGSRETGYGPGSDCMTFSWRATVAPAATGRRPVPQPLGHPARNSAHARPHFAVEGVAPGATPSEPGGSGSHRLLLLRRPSTALSEAMRLPGHICDIMRTVSSRPDALARRENPIFREDRHGAVMLAHRGPQISPCPLPSAGRGLVRVVSGAPVAVCHDRGGMNAGAQSPGWYSKLVSAGPATRPAVYQWPATTVPPFHPKESQKRAVRHHRGLPCCALARLHEHEQPRVTSTVSPSEGSRTAHLSREVLTVIPTRFSLLQFVSDPRFC